MTLCLLLLALLSPPDPHLIAQWDSSTSATITWSQSARSCLYAKSGRVFVACYTAPGDYAISFGHAGPMSGDVRPAGGDVFILDRAGQRESAPLVGRSVYLPAQLGGRSITPVSLQPS